MDKIYRTRVLAITDQEYALEKTRTLESAHLHEFVIKTHLWTVPVSICFTWSRTVIRLGAGWLKKIMTIPGRGLKLSRFNKMSRSVLGPLIFVFNRYSILWPHREVGRNVKLTSHLLLVQRLRMCGPISLTPPPICPHGVHRNFIFSMISAFSFLCQPNHPATWPLM
jgi:hypothetical protein